MKKEIQSLREEINSLIKEKVEREVAIRVKLTESKEHLLEGRSNDNTH